MSAAGHGLSADGASRAGDAPDDALLGVDGSGGSRRDGVAATRGGPHRRRGKEERCSEEMHGWKYTLRYEPAAIASNEGVPSTSKMERDLAAG